MPNNQQPQNASKPNDKARDARPQQNQQDKDRAAKSRNDDAKSGSNKSGN